MAKWGNGCEQIETAQYFHHLVVRVCFPKELPHRLPMRLQWTIAEVTKKADETPPRKLHGKSGHSYNSVETYMNLHATSVLYLADGTSVNTISIANTKLAISENTACNGCRWK